jgi:tRNA pseudouridine55 synthase
MLLGKFLNQEVRKLLRVMTTMLNGLINLDKSPGISSARAVAIVKRLLPCGAKIGHAGTLDPFATGVLLLLIGKATKLCESFMSMAKQYQATIRFGATTETDDLDSEPRPYPGAAAVSIEQVREAMEQFVGEIQQRPPVFSALKLQGRRAYDLAREGKLVELKARTVRIDRIEVVEYQWPDLTIEVDCGRGTYIRSIARDLGEALKVGGYLSALRRTRIGAHGIDQAVTIERVQADGAEAHLLQISQ